MGYRTEPNTKANEKGAFVSLYVVTCGLIAYNQMRHIPVVLLV